MKTRMDLSPWLAGVFVPPENRSRGIASSLVRAIENLAGDLGYEEIFLYTNCAEGLYKILDWVEIGREEYKGREVVIMSKMITT
jgi:N-acetylglutamate synthase-like GNAT family acetyltransferase